MSKKFKIVPAKEEDLDTVIKKFIEDLRKAPDYKSKFIDYIKEKENRIKLFIKPGKSPIKKPPNQLIILRRWNSYTPLLPHSLDEYTNKGGGYFIRIKNTGIIIDPGFNFIENFLRAGFKLDDIDHIFISHAHNDHTVELEGIFSLLHKRNKNNSNKLKKVKLYMNLGSFKKFSSYFDLSNPLENFYVEDIILLNKHQLIKLNDSIDVFTTQVKHHEMITKQYALGFTFIFNLNGGKRIIKFTCDTGWDNNMEERNKKEAEEFQINKVDILISHIGSIKEKELGYDTKKSLKENLKNFYEHHLGFIGTAAAIHFWQPELVLLSEFGEELCGIRVKISEILSNELNVNVFSTDINFRVDLDKMRIMCFKTRDYWDPKEIRLYLGPKDQLYPYREKSLTQIEKTEPDKCFGTTIKAFD